MPGLRTPIDDPDDPRLEHFRHLKRTNVTRHSGEFVVEGDKLLEQLRRSRFPITSVLVSERSEALVAPRVPEGVPLYVMPHPLVERLIGYNQHRGILATARRVPWPSLDELADSAGPRGVMAVCPQIDNPDNLGSILRIADVFGLAAVVTGYRCPDPLSRRVLRVSMGMGLQVPVAEPKDLRAALLDLRERHGFALAATVLDPSAEPIDAFDPGGRVAVLFGCEAHGLAPEWEALCDRRVTIPMRPGAESLNLAVAAGIILSRLAARPGGGAERPLT